jgi:hypothetical protein
LCFSHCFSVALAEVFGSALQQPWFVAKQADSHVARSAEKSAYLACRVAMVDIGRAIAAHLARCPDVERIHLLCGQVVESIPTAMRLTERPARALIARRHRALVHAFGIDVTAPASDAVMLAAVSANTRATLASGDAASRLSLAIAHALVMRGAQPATLYKVRAVFHTAECTAFNFAGAPSLHPVLHAQSAALLALYAT